jgi:hypothetical protein
VVHWTDSINQGPYFGLACELIIGWSNPMNKENDGNCWTKNDYENCQIEADGGGNSPLTGEKKNFTVAEFEVFAVTY